MRNFTWNRFPIKNLLIDSLLTPIVESTHHPDCYASCWLIFLPCVGFVSIYASTAIRSCILNYMWTATNFIIKGCMLCTVTLHVPNFEVFLTLPKFGWSCFSRPNFYLGCWNLLKYLKYMQICMTLFQFDQMFHLAWIWMELLLFSQSLFSLLEFTQIFPIYANIFNFTQIWMK